MRDPIRQCCITKKKLPRSQLWRLVRLPDSVLVVDKCGTMKGRSLHFIPEEGIIQKFFDPRKRKMAEHFLRVSCSPQEWEKLHKEVIVQS